MAIFSNRPSTDRRSSAPALFLVMNDCTWADHALNLWNGSDTSIRLVSNSQPRHIFTSSGAPSA
eukprot:4121367-Ditylum_brightwellii.AAC.1